MRPEAYCVNCNFHIHKRPKGQWKKVEILNPTDTYIKTKRMKKGQRRMLKGTCPDCGKRIAKFIKG